MNKRVAFLLITAFLLSGCHATHQLPREIIIVPDISKSIDPQAEQQMFAGIQTVATRLQRGDSLTIIPITGAADAELQGQTLHYRIPSAEDRQAYDSDVRKLNMQIKSDLTRLQAESLAHPGKHTDILGSVRVAMQQFASGRTDARLIILSDFIQDDEQYNFTTDRRIESTTTATKMATELGKQTPFPARVKVTMGRLKSAEFTELPIRRRMAINAFWSRLFAPSSVASDGIFALQNTIFDEPRPD